jgi:hypothetical protein
MRNLTILSALLLILIFGTSGCEKDNTEGAHLRIAKIADNQAMENSKTFEYNSAGLLSRITSVDRQLDIEYNGNGQPVKVTESFIEYQSIWSVKNITWDNEGFVTTEEEDLNQKSLYKLTSKGQLASQIDLRRETSESDFDTIKKVEFTWIGNDSLKIKTSYIPPYFEEEIETEYYKFGTSYSVYKGISIGLFSGNGFPDDDLEEIQNIYGTTKHYTSSGDIWTYKYELNSQNFPVKANETFKNIEGTSGDNYYFEYESY